MDPRLFKALTDNRIAIARRFTGTEPRPSDDLTLLHRCLDLSFHDTERTIREAEQPGTVPVDRATTWLGRMKRLFKQPGHRKRV